MKTNKTFLEKKSEMKTSPESFTWRWCDYFETRSDYVRKVLTVIKSNFSLHFLHRSPYELLVNFPCYPEKLQNAFAATQNRRQFAFYDPTAYSPNKAWLHLNFQLLMFNFCGQIYAESIRENQVGTCWMKRLVNWKNVTYDGRVRILTSIHKTCLRKSFFSTL